MIDLKKITPQSHHLECWSGNYKGYAVEIYKKLTPFSYVPKWFYRIRKENFLFDSFSENQYGFQEKRSASGGAYLYINEL